jgi:hypothetical protein
MMEVRPNPILPDQPPSPAGVSSSRFSKPHTNAPSPTSKRADGKGFENPASHRRISEGGDQLIIKHRELRPQEIPTYSNFYKMDVTLPIEEKPRV